MSFNSIVQLSQKIKYANLGQFDKHGDSTQSSRANTTSSESGTKRKSLTASGTDTDSNPNGAAKHLKKEDAQMTEETPGGNPDIVEGLRLSECYTLDSPS